MLINAPSVCVLLLACALAKPAAAQVTSAPKDLLASEGIDATPPQGFPPFVQIRDHSGSPFRMYRSLRDTRTILISVMGPLSWSDSSLDARHRLLEMRESRREWIPSRPGSDTTWVDSTHLVRQSHWLQPDGKHGVERIYIPRSGAPTFTGIIALDEGDTPNPAFDPEILAFLDQARPRTDVGPPDLLAREGIHVAPPAGFPAFEPFADTTRGHSRIYRSRSGTRSIMISVRDPFFSWGSDGLDPRRGVLQAMANRFGRDSTHSAETIIREDSTHLWSDAPLALPGGERTIHRWYMPRTGAPAIVGILVTDATADPAADPGVLAFLDAARPWPDTGTPASLVFQENELSMVLTPGLVPPTASSESVPGMRILVSRSGSRYLWCMILDHPERGASRWPTERRVQHLREFMSEFLDAFAARMEPQVYARGELAYSEVRFDRAPGLGGVAGRGRIYTTQSGPHRMLAIMYFETDTTQIVSEAAIEDMLDSVRLLAPN